MQELSPNCLIRNAIQVSRDIINKKIPEKESTTSSTIIVIPNKKGMKHSPCIFICYALDSFLYHYMYAHMNGAFCFIDLVL